MTDSKPVFPIQRVARNLRQATTLASIAVVFLVACDESSKRSGESSVPIQETGSLQETVAGALDSDSQLRFRAALEGAAADPGKRTGLELIASCRRGSKWRSTRIFGSGVAIWEGERQFQLTEDELFDLLQQLLTADFPSLPDRYGGPPEPDRMQSNNARTVVCSLSVSLAGVEKEVFQINRGEQSESFARLVNRLLDSCEEPAATGVGAANLEEGLEKVASGELEPVTFELHYQVMADGAAPGESVTEFVLGVEGQTATVRLRDLVDGYSEPSQLELTGDELSELVWKLAGTAPSRFLKNLWAPSYTDLSVRVLNHKMSLVARPYSGVDEETHGELQQDFDATIELLDALRERVLHEGASAVPTR